MMKFLYTLLLVGLINFGSYSQSFEAKISPNEIKIGQQANVTIELSFSAEKRNFSIIQTTDTLSKFVEIVNALKLDTTYDEVDVTQKYLTQKITVTSWDSGLHVIPPFIAILNGDTLKSNPLLLNVNSVQLAAEQDIKDIKDIIEVSFSLWDWILTNKVIIIFILGSILFAVIGYFVWKKMKNKPVEEKEIIVPKEAADKVAKEKLEQLQSAKLWQSGKIKAYHSQLSFIVREYIENRFEVNALEQTTEEIKTILEGFSTISKEELVKIYNLLTLADLAKFAKQQPIASENEMAMKDAEAFIQSTKLEENLAADNSKIEEENA